MHSKLVRNTDPTTTQSMERAYEALVDAGTNYILKEYNHSVAYTILCLDLNTMSKSAALVIIFIL